MARFALGHNLVAERVDGLALHNPPHQLREARLFGGLLGPVDPSFRALSGRLEFTVRRHKFNKDSLVSGGAFLTAVVHGRFERDSTPYESNKIKTVEFIRDPRTHRFFIGDHFPRGADPPWGGDDFI